MDIEDLLEMAQEHGDEAGSDYQIGDLEALLYEAWTLLTEEQRQSFLASPVVTDLVSMTDE